jgi:hypothetical protein
MLGNSPLYTQFKFDLTSYRLRTIVDCKMPVPVALFRIGGFAFTVYVLAYMMAYFWQYFHAEIALIESLYLFTAPSRDV